MFVIFQALAQILSAEYFFTTDLALFAGHYFKILASFIIAYVLLKSTVISPNDILYKEIVYQRNQLSKLLKYETLTREITEICSSAVNNNTFIEDVLEILGSTLKVDHTFIYKHISYPENHTNNFLNFKRNSAFKTI